MTFAVERSLGVLTLRGAAAFLKVHPNTVRSQAKKRLIPATKVGRDWRFLEADLVEWIRSAYPEGARPRSRMGERDSNWTIGSQGIAPASQVLVERSLDALLERPERPRPRKLTA